MQDKIEWATRCQFKPAAQEGSQNPEKQLTLAVGKQSNGKSRCSSEMAGYARKTL